MKKPAKVRKPEPFKADGQTICECASANHERWLEFYSPWGIGPRDIARLRRWLARAEAWCRQGGGA